MKLNYIILKCANGEEFRIKGEHIGNTKIDGISESIRRSSTEIDAIDIKPVANIFAIEIKKGADHEYHFSNPENFNNVSIDLCICQTLFDRLTRIPDITQITFCTGHSPSINQFKTIDLPKDIYNCKNNLETAAIGKSGNLYLRIACPAEDIALDDLDEVTDEQIELTLY